MRKRQIGNSVPDGPVSPDVRWQPWLLHAPLFRCHHLSHMGALVGAQGHTAG